MLLKGSEVAKSIRTYLLDVEHLSSTKAKTKALINQVPEELRTDKMKVLLAEKDTLIEKLLTDNEMLRKHEFLSKTQRYYINNALQTLALTVDEHPATIWNKFYSSLYITQNIDIYRYPKSYIHYCFKSDWEPIKNSVFQLYEKYEQRLPDGYFLPTDLENAC